MKKSTKRFCLKLAASILSTTLVASIALPMNVLATTVDTTTEILSENTTINSSSPDYSENIIREVEEERDEFSKTFLMADGTYYTFLSRPFCTLYASKILSETGSWDYLNGRNVKNMGVERIASNLFARCVGNYAESAINRVNATWGDGWIVSNRNSNTIIITESDLNADKYMKIWLAAPSIKSFATAHGIYITV